MHSLSNYFKPLGSIGKCPDSESITSFFVQFNLSKNILLNETSVQLSFSGCASNNGHLSNFSGSIPIFGFSIKYKNSIDTFVPDERESYIRSLLTPYYLQ